MSCSLHFDFLRPDQFATPPRPGRARNARKSSKRSRNGAKNVAYWSRPTGRYVLPMSPCMRRCSWLVTK